MVILNNTVSAISSFSDGSSWFGMIIIVGILAVVLSTMVLMIASIQFYFKGRKYLDFIIGSVKYFFFGIATLFCLSIPILIFYYFFNQAKKGNIVPIKITLIIILGYIVTAFIGWFSRKYIFERVKLFEIKYREQENEKPI